MKLWPGHHVNRRTDGQTDRHCDSYIPPQTLFAGGGIIMVFETYNHLLVMNPKCINAFYLPLLKTEQQNGSNQSRYMWIQTSCMY